MSESRVDSNVHRYVHKSQIRDIVIGQIIDPTQTQPPPSIIYLSIINRRRCHITTVTTTTRELQRNRLRGIRKNLESFLIWKKVRAIAKTDI